jgi:GT2 family glycosyltransferase
MPNPDHSLGAEVAFPGALFPATETLSPEADAPVPRQISPPPRRREEFRQEAWRRRFLDDGPIDVSVCIANWNCCAMLRACLESLLDRDQGARLEVIVVDNGSTDGAADMVEQEFPDVILFRNTTNRGFAQANNQAARRSQGRYLLFLNNDTLVPEGTLGRLLAYAQTHPEVGMVGPRLQNGRGQIQVSYRLKPTLGTFLHRTSLLRWTGLFRAGYRRYRRQDFDAHTVRHVEVLMGAALLLPRQVFFDCGGWDEDYVFGGEDLDLSLRVSRQHAVVYLPEAEIVHFGRASTRQHIGFASTHMAIGFVRYLRKSGCSRPALWAYKLIVTLDVPLQMAGKAWRYLWRRLRGRRQEADRTWLALRALGHFLFRGLGPFWKA